MTGLQLLVLTLAVHRLVVLIRQDKVTGPIRGRVIRWAYLRDGMDPEMVGNWRDADELAEGDQEAPAVAYLLKCWWCAGLWVSIGWTVFWWAAPVSCWWASLALALSTGLVLVERVASLLSAHGNA